MNKTILIILFAFCGTLCCAQKITASPGWSVSVPSTTITEAGNNYTINMTSLTNQTLIDVKPGSYSSYTVTVQKADTDWHSSLTLWVQRTGNGTGAGGPSSTAISGGATFMQVTSSPQSFFYDATGSANNRNNIPIQYEIRGLSVIVPVKTYTTTVIYTIINL